MTRLLLLSVRLFICVYLPSVTLGHYTDDENQVTLETLNVASLYALNSTDYDEVTTSSSLKVLDAASQNQMVLEYVLRVPDDGYSPSFNLYEDARIDSTLRAQCYDRRKIKKCTDACQSAYDGVCNHRRCPSGFLKRAMGYCREACKSQFGNQ